SRGPGTPLERGVRALSSRPRFRGGQSLRLVFDYLTAEPTLGSAAIAQRNGRRYLARSGSAPDLAAVGALLTLFTALKSRGAGRAKDGEKYFGFRPTQLKQKIEAGEFSSQIGSITFSTNPVSIDASDSLPITGKA